MDWKLALARAGSLDLGMTAIPRWEAQRSRIWAGAMTRRISVSGYFFIMCPLTLTMLAGKRGDSVMLEQRVDVFVHLYFGLSTNGKY